MRILVGMEYSGRVRNAFRELGHDAWSVCDTKSEDSSPYHIVGDVLDYLNEDWDLGIFHPTCTYNCLSGLRWMYHPEDSDLSPELRRRHPNYPDRMDNFEKNIEVFIKLKESKIPKKAIENSKPHGIAISRIGKPTQVVQPWMFGDPYKKSICWWLTNLPELKPTKIMPKFFRHAKCHKTSGPDRAIERSRTEPGVAKAIAEQWGV